MSNRFLQGALTAAICGILSLRAGAVSAADDATKPDFDRRIAPLLAQRCLECHGSAEPKGKLNLSAKDTALKGGESGRAIEPGKPDESLLWQHIRDDEMPPTHPLPAAEKALLREWIQAGAPWGTDPIDPFKYTTAQRAGYDWWALQPLQSASPPAVKQTDWVRVPIDTFVLAGLEKRGLKPNPEAERRVLIRRLTFDLLGLPPTPEEIAAFLADQSSDAYEKLVDRLLASPHYGEHWARHWLDVARYGESNGFERDLPRPNAWPYRDWVASALNRDMPYDEFARWQVAGDVLHPDNPTALAATGFLVAGAHDTVLPVGDVMKMTMRQDELEDIVGTVGQAFLGITVNCARCHDHKFDPISQREYYQFAAALAGVDHGERELPRPRHDQELAQINTEHGERSRELSELEAPIRRAILKQRRDKADTVAAPKPLAEWDFQTDLKDRIGGLHATTEGGAKQSSEGLQVDGKGAFVKTVLLERDLAEKTLEAWVRLANLEQRGGGVIGVQSRDNNVFDAIVFGEKEPAKWMAGSNFFARTQPFSGPAEIEAHQQAVHIAIVYSADGAIAAYRNGQPYGRPYPSKGIQTFKRGEAEIVFGIRHGPPGENKMLAGTIFKARLYDRALTAAEVLVSHDIASASIDAKEIRNKLDTAARERHVALTAQLAQLTAGQKRLNDQPPTMIYTVISQQTTVQRLLKRGSVATPGEIVTPAGLAAVPGIKPDFGLSPDAADAQRRKALALWLTDRQSPLFARVAVNRIWHYHFGAGIVDTPNDFGFNGGRPSHPELLDWLAGELWRRGGSLKSLHRLIVTSATYRQSSAFNATAAKIDEESRLFWRFRPQRLSAEAVRDAILAASGELNRTVGGKGYSDMNSYFFLGTQFYDPIDAAGPEANRRTLYRMWARSGRSPWLDAFDCPDPSTTTPVRASTTTPLQALALLNNAFVQRQSDHLAARLERDAPDLDARITRAYALLFVRKPEAEELQLGRAFIAQRGLSAYARVLLNTNEFLHVD